MKISLRDDYIAANIASWLSENVSPGYAFRPMWNQSGNALHYKAYDDTWRVRLEEHSIEIEGLQPEQESIVGLIFT